MNEVCTECLSDRPGVHVISCSRSRAGSARTGEDASPPGIREITARIDPPHPTKGRPEYGGFDNLECAGELAMVYDKWAAQAARTGTRKAQSYAHEHAIRMVLTKISRIATGSYIGDNYDDAKVYAELAKQIRQRDER